MSLTQINKAGLDELALDHVFTIGASGSSAYTFQGEGLNGTVSNPTLYLTRGKTYRFENGSGGHPIRIQSTSGASGTAYNTGVTNNAGSGTVIVEVQHDAPDVLYYQCTSHAAMNGILYITGSLADGGVTTAKLADDAVTDAKLANSINSAIAANTAKTSLENNSVTTAKIADEAVTLAKLPHGTSSNDGKFLRANNGADPTFETVNTDLVSDTSPQLGGDLDTNSHNISLDDNHKVNFGDSSDLQIYHSGSESFIADEGTGGITISGGVLSFKNQARDETFATMTVNGAVELYHDNVKALNTYSNGIQVGFNQNNPRIMLPDNGIVSWGTSDSASIQATDAGSGGYMKFNVANGNRITINGNGLCFNNDTAAANALDDYEEGSWTPEVSFGNTTTGQSYGLQVGRYTRIGNRCFVTCYVYFTNKGSSTGTARIGGLPFTSASISNNYQHGSVWMNTWNGSSTVPTGYVEVNSTVFRLERQRADGLGSGISSMDNTNFNNTTDVMISVHYQVN